MNNTKIYLDIHAVQTLPPSNINRDDTGSPKTAQYGGVTRARVSSQAWKRAMREYFYEYGDLHNVGVRTLEIVQYIAGKIMELDSSKSEESAMELADKVINMAGVKTKDRRAKALFFLGDIQAEELAQKAIAGVDDKKELQSVLQHNPSIDIALFGRMVADDPTLNEDASAQVAHAISTHGVETEFDFYTAVDDLAPEDNAGAGMLGTLEYNSSTLYRYANVAVHELKKQLGNKQATIAALKLFVEAFSNSLPTGKINSYANQTIPQLLLVTLRTDRPVSLVSAFEQSICSREGYAQKSIKALFDEFERVQKFTASPVFTSYVSLDSDLRLGANIMPADNLRDLDERLGSQLQELIKE